MLTSICRPPCDLPLKEQHNPRQVNALNDPLYRKEWWVTGRIIRLALYRLPVTALDARA
jgi:hypothetical protein